jgi:hypothetical protein
VVIRGYHRQSHLEGGGVDDRHQLATACIERRASAHRTARERIDEFGLLILRVGKGSCNQRSSEAIDEFGLIILRVGKGSCNQRSSEAIKSRTSAIRGRHGRSEPIRVSERQSKDSHMQFCGNQRQPEATRGNRMCTQMQLRGNHMKSNAIKRPSEAIRGHQCNSPANQAAPRPRRRAAAPRAPVGRGEGAMVSTCMQGEVQKRFSSPASTAASPGRMQ